MNYRDKKIDTFEKDSLKNKKIKNFLYSIKLFTLGLLSCFTCCCCLGGCCGNIDSSCFCFTEINGNENSDGRVYDEKYFERFEKKVKKSSNIKRWILVGSGTCIAIPCCCGCCLGCCGKCNVNDFFDQDEKK